MMIIVIEIENGQVKTGKIHYSLAEPVEHMGLAEEAFLGLRKKFLSGEFKEKLIPFNK